MRGGVRGGVKGGVRVMREVCARDLEELCDVFVFCTWDLSWVGLSFAFCLSFSSSKNKKF